MISPIGAREPAPIDEPLDKKPGVEEAPAPPIQRQQPPSLTTKEVVTSRVLEINEKVLFSGYKGVLYRDEKGTIQAIALYQESDPHTITLLGSYPNNLLHPVNEGIPDRVYGAASALVICFIQRAFLAGASVKLVA